MGIELCLNVGYLQLHIWLGVFMWLFEWTWTLIISYFLGHVVIPCLTLWRNENCFCKIATASYTTMYNNHVWELQCLSVLMSTCHCPVYFGRSGDYEVAPHCGLSYISLVTSELSTFSGACWSLVCLIWRNIYSDPLPMLIRLFVYLQLSCKSSEYSPLSDTQLTNILFISVSFHFLDAILWKTQKINFDTAHYTCFFFCQVCFWFCI
jgi:hypothetical protein